jgi:hypothetical protein
MRVMTEIFYGLPNHFKENCKTNVVDLISSFVLVVVAVESINFQLQKEF